MRKSLATQLYDASRQAHEQEMRAKGLDHAHILDRTYWYAEALDRPGGHTTSARRSSRWQANLVGSLTERGTHKPALDIDYGAALVPSTTPGHYHLFLQTDLPWWKYRVVLRVLAWAGIIQKGFAKHSIARGMSCVRAPGVRKPANAPSSGAGVDFGW